MINLIESVGGYLIIWAKVMVLICVITSDYILRIVKGTAKIPVVCCIRPVKKLSKAMCSFSHSVFNKVRA